MKKFFIFGISFFCFIFLFLSDVDVVKAGMANYYCFCFSNESAIKDYKAGKIDTIKAACSSIEASSVSNADTICATKKDSSTDCKIVFLTITGSDFIKYDYNSESVGELCNSNVTSFMKEYASDPTEGGTETKGGTETEFVIPPDLEKSLGDLNKMGNVDIPVLIGKGIKLLMQVIGTIALLMFVYGGLLWMVSAGNTEKTKKAMDIMLWAGLGVIVILSSYAIVNFVFGLVK